MQEAGGTSRGNGAALAEAPVAHIGDAVTALAVRRVGHGPPLLLLPGFPLHGLTYRRVVPLLQDACTCYCVDLPGCGESRWTADTDFSMPAHARRLSRMADHFRLERMAVLGHDTGGAAARHFALLDARIDKLILINTEIPHHRPPWIPTYQRLLALPGAVVALRLLFRSEVFLRSSAGFGGCFQDRRLIGDEFKRLFVRPLVEDGRRAMGYSKYLRGFDWAENDAFATRHAAITARTLFIWGREDPTFPEAMGRQMAAQFSACAGFESVGATRLLPHEERPDEVARLARNFLLAA